MNTDIDAVTDLLQKQSIWKVVRPYIEQYNAHKNFEMRPPSPTATILGKPSSVEKSLLLKKIQTGMKKPNFNNENDDNDNII